MNNSAKIRIAVLFGGRSGEHEVSLRSAESVIGALDRTKYEIVPVGITHEGRWRTSDNAAAVSPSDIIQDTIAAGRALPFGPEPQALPVADVFFPVLHGTFGEDGTVQGLLELADVPYVGAGVLGSAVGMDKDVMKRLLREADLPVGDHWVLHSHNVDAFLSEYGGRLPYPVFVKPANLGSSVGISKARTASELPKALALAADFDRKIVVEKGLEAREIEISVLGNDTLQASVPGEIVPARDFYDYTAKYVTDDSKLLIPAPLAPDEVSLAQALAKRTFQVLECSGMARVDLFLEKSTGKFFVNEINTLPGFTSISMYPKLWQASGLPYPQLIDRLIELALERHKQKKKLRRKYDD